MAINDCPETASETYLRKNLVLCYFKVKKFQKKSQNSPYILVYIFQMEKNSIKFDNIAYSTNHAKP